LLRSHAVSSTTVAIQIRSHFADSDHIKSAYISIFTLQADPNINRCGSVVAGWRGGWVSPLAVGKISYERYGQGDGE